MNPLAQYSSAQLLAELRRRERESKPPKPIIPCDECAHFVFATTQNPDFYNPCSKGHTMAFKMPEDCTAREEDWGYHRPRCRDRVTRRKT